MRLIILSVVNLILMTSCGGSDSQEPRNTLPVIQTISTQEVNEGETVNIKVDAIDKESTQLTYFWKQVSGMSVELNSNNHAELSFVAPDVALADIKSSLVFTVEVSDAEGAKSTTEARVDVLALATPPVIENVSYKSELFSNQTSTIDCTVADSDGEIVELKLSHIAGTAVSFVTENNCPFLIKAPHVDSKEEITLQLSVKDNDELTSHSPLKFMLSPTQRLNDTGVMTCIDYKNNNDLDCSLATDDEGDPIPYGQDGHYGRDAEQRAQLKNKKVNSQGIYKRNKANLAQRNTSEVFKGFSYTKIAADGTSLNDEAASWSCVKDNVTGLLWEIKTIDGSLHDRDYTYTWYEPDNNKNAGFAGVEDGGECVSESCDTHHYVIDVNKEGYCGVNNWRLPTPMELFSLSDLSREKPAINRGYFLNNLEDASFWSAVPVVPTEYFYGFSKVYNSKYGIIGVLHHSSANAIRLVANQQN